MDSVIVRNGWTTRGYGSASHGTEVRELCVQNSSSHHTIRSRSVETVRYPIPSATWARVTSHRA